MVWFLNCISAVKHCTPISYIFNKDVKTKKKIIHGLHDNDISVLSRNTAGELTTLPKLIDYIAAEEGGINESQNLSKNTVGGIRNSSYKKSKFKAAKSCGHCGGQHPSMPNSPHRVSLVNCVLNSS